MFYVLHRLLLLLGAVGQALCLTHMGFWALSLQSLTVECGGAGGWYILAQLRGVIRRSQRVPSPREGASGDPGESRWRQEARGECLACRDHGTAVEAPSGGGAMDNGRRSSRGRPGHGKVGRTWALGAGATNHL